MRLTSLVQTVSGFPCPTTLPTQQKSKRMSFVSLCFALMAGAFAGQVASAQTLVLTKTPAVTDIYSSGVQAFPATAVGTNSAVINLKLTVTGGALRITSIGLPALPTGSTRIPQFTVGAITGCTVNGTTSNATGTVCTVPITFNPAYVGYQTSPLVAVTSNGNFQYGLNGMGTGPQAILLPGILSTVAGNGTAQATAMKYTGDGGQATAAQVLSHGFAFDALGNLYEAEYDADVIRKISPTGVISTVIGAETTAGGVETSTVCTTPNTVPSCGDGGVATAANFGQFLPDVALDSAGNIYVADSIDNRIRRVDAVTNIINTIAGTGNALTTGTGNNGDGAAATAADLNTPEAVLLDNADNIYMLNSNAIVAAPATTNPSVIRYIDSATGVITTLAGVATPCTATGAGTCGDGGPASAANLAIAASFYLDPTTGNYWIADRDANRIRFVNRATGIISTVAGTGVKGYTGDGGLATAATLDGPHGIWVDPAGDLYISDRGNNVVRYVSASTGIISTIAGGGAACAAAGNGSCGDGGLSNGPLANMTPEDVRLDVNGNVYVGDGENDAIRKITTSPITLTFPTVPVGTTSGPLTAVLRNIGSSTLTYTTPTSGTNAAISTTGPTATASNAFAQGNTTTCGPISSTSAANDTLASGASCNFVVTFTPDTAAGNYTGTLIETDNSLNAGAGNTHYPTDATQTVNLVGAATVQTATITLTSTPNPSTYGTSVAFTATLSGVAGSTVPTGTVAFTYTAPGSTTVVSIGTGTVSTVNGAQVATINYALFPVGTNTVTATYSGDSNYASGTKATDSQVVSVAAGSKDTLTATPTTSTFGTSVALTFTVPTTAGLTAPSGTVTFTSGGVTLGTATIATAGGVSTAVINTTKLPVGTDTIAATYPGDANYGSAAPTATETVTQAAGTDTLTANPTTSQFGSPVVLTFTVPTVAGATANPTGTVTFSSGGITLGTGTLTTTGTGASAVTTATLTTSALAPGTDTITGAYPGDTNYSAQSPTTTETVGAATGTYVLTAAPVTSTYGAPVVLTFTVPLINGVAPSGTVTFTNGTTTLGTGTINASGVATLTTTALPVGTDTVKGSYPGDANYTAGTATATETVAKADGGTADTLTATPATSTFGSPVVLKFTVPTVAGAAASPTGTVTFTQGTTTLGTGTLTTTGTGANAVTTATLTTSSLPVGTDTVIGTYPGDANYSNAAPTATEAVTKATPADTLTYSPAAPTFGAPVTLTFTIPTVTGATATPTGTVTFTNGTTQLGTGTITTVGGVSTATITTTALPVGSDTVTATYPGDTNYAAAAPAATVPVTKAAGTGDTLTANPTSATFGSPVVLTFTVPTVTGAAASPTGTVTFTSGGVTLGTGTLSTTGTGANAVTTATLTTSALPTGTDTVTGTYPGDTNYANGSATTTVTIGAATGADTLTANPASSTFGSPVVLTFTVPLINGTAPTGTVTFTNGTTTLGTAPVNASGQATLTTTALPVGTDPLKATYPGDANYAAAAPTATETVTKASGNGDTLTANPTTSTYGASVVLTFTVPTVAGATASPTGTVTFTQGATTLGTGTLTTTGTGAAAITTATLTTNSLPVGTDTIIGTYPGDANYSNAAPTATETVTAASGTGDTLTYSPSAPTFGSPVVLTFTIPPVTGATAAPTGTVTFTNGTTQLGTGTITTVGGVSTATITTTSLPVGNDVVTATYPGNGSYAAAAPTATVPVTKASGAGDTLTANPTSSTYGASVVLTFTVPTVAGATASPTGTVTFTNGTTTLGTGTLSTTGTGANAVTTATLTTTALPVGTDTVTGTYPGDTNYANGSATATETVASAGTDTLTASPSPSTFGAPVTLTFTVPTVAGASTSPTGTVTFTSGGVTLGTGTISTVNGVSTATLTTTALPVGTDTITAAYPGSPNYPAASPTTTDTINKAGGTGAGDTLTANPTTSTVGSPVVLTFTVAPAVAGASASPTGTVTFTSGGVTLGTGTLTTTGTGANAVTTATLTTSTLPVGTDTVTGTYPGDTNYVGGNATATETVSKGAGTGDTLTANPTTTTYGSPVVLTFTVAPITGVTTAPTGSVTFTSGTQTLGTATITTTGGVSTATITTTALPVGSDLITGTYAGDTNYGAATPTATETITKSNGGSGGPTLSVNPTSTAFGSPVVVTYNEGTVAGATLPATGTVVFTSGGITLGTGTLTTTGTGATAVTTATITTSVLPVGTDTITGTYGGDTNYNGAAPTATETVGAAGSDTVTATPSPATYGAPVTLTFNVPTPAGVTSNPTGTVTFTSGGVTLGTAPIATLNGTSTATITTSVLPIGTDTITATYGGSPNYPAAAPTTNETINKAAFGAPNDVLATNPNPSTFGQTVTITETLTTVGAAAPTGSINFIYNGTSLGTATIAGGVASITTATLPVGTDPITATYAGDANYAAGTSGPVNQVVNQALSIATLAAGPNPATYGTPVTLTETITPINGTCPAGPATFLNNGTTLGTGTISLSGGYCVAMLTASTLPVGTDQITATVPGSGGFDPTTSGPVALVINKANNADTLASSPNPSVFGSPVTITDTIPTVAGTAPTGTVNFFDFGVQIGTGTVNAAGVATLVTSTLPVGTDSLTATYLGDGNYAQVTAGPVNQVVSPVSGNQATLAVGPNPATFGTKVTFTETIPTVNGTPATGQVLFYQNGTLVGAGTLAGGVATITTTTLPVGTDPITATYGGDTNYAAASSGPVNEIINKAIGADTLAVSPDPALVGTTVTMTDTIPTVGGVAPTGTVTFYDNGTAIGTGTVNGQGVATLTTTALPIGSDPITAVYGGDGNYAPVTTGPVNEVITQISEPVALGANPNPAAFGATVTLTESVPGINGISPTGSVTFYDSGTAIGTAPLTNGVATLPVSNLPIGTDPITATYTGDTNYAGANSGPLNVVITTVPSADTLTANPNPSTFGSPVTLTFTVPPVNGVAPTGTVTFYNGTTPIGTATISPSGIATLTTSQLPFGTDPITAKYPGDNTYAPASPTVTVTVNPVSPTSIVTVPAGSPICGSSVTLTDTITPVNGVALGGTVQFYDNGTAIGSPVPVPASGIVTLTTTSLACTTDIITAIYTPPANSPYLPSTGGPTSITVNKPDFSITATPPNQTVNPGDTTTYTVSLSGVGLPFTSPVTLTATGLPPGATVSFANGTYVPNAGPTSTTMTIVTAPNQAVLHHSSSTNGIYYGLLLLPLLGLGKVRRKIKALPKGITYCLAGLIMLGGLGAVTGCGGGYFGPAPQTFTITVTGTSGTLVHSTTVTLTVR